MKKILLIVVACAAAFGLLSAKGTFFSPDIHAVAATDPSRASASNPVVLELFTSQGCSSCPPADLLAAKLAKEPALIMIVRPVTYWDRLGWKDTLARKENTTLQRGYARKGHQGSGVYTPQVVVDGRAGAVGSDERNLRALIRAAGTAAKPRIAVRKLASGGAAASISGTVKGPAELVLVALSSHEAVRIARGENGGRVVHYTNVVLAENRVASAAESGKTYAINPAALQFKGADRYALILRQPDAGRVLAGAFIR